MNAVKNTFSKLSPLKILTKAKYLLVELCIVFIGVYGAFMLNKYNEQQKVEVQRQKMYVTLNKELVELQQTFESISNYHDSINEVFKVKHNQKELIPEVERYRYIAPQYSLQIIENALNNNSFNMMDLELHIEISKLYANLQQLIYTEQKITDVSEKYSLLTAQQKEEKFNLNKWSLIYLEDRRSILKRLDLKTQELIKELNKRIEKD